MNLPENDVRALLCIAPEAALKMTSVVSIKHAADALESADYAGFWALTKEKDLAEICLTVPDFEGQVSHQLMVLGHPLHLYVFMYILICYIYITDLLLPPFYSQIRRFICGTLAYSCRDLPRLFVENCLALSGKALDSFTNGSSDISSITSDRVYFFENSFNTKTVHSHKYSVPDISRILRMTAN